MSTDSSEPSKSNKKQLRTDSVRSTQDSFALLDTMSRRLEDSPSNRFQLDSSLLQDAKDRIKQQIDRLHSTAKSEQDPSRFLDTAFGTIAEILGAESIALWHWSPVQGWEFASGWHFPERFIPTPEEKCFQSHASNSVSPPSTAISVELQSHFKLLEAVRQEGQSVLIPPAGVDLLASRPTNPTHYQILWAPVTLKGETGELWLEVLQPPSGTLANQRGFLRFCNQMADLMGSFLTEALKRRRLTDQQFFARCNRWLDRCSVSPENTPSTTGNFLKEIASARHAMLLTRESPRKHWRIQAVAGLAKIDRRAEAVELVEQAIRKAERHSPDSALTWFFSEGPSSKSSSSKIGDLAALASLLKTTKIAWCKPQSYHGDSVSVSSLKPNGNTTSESEIPILSLLHEGRLPTVSPVASGVENIGLLIAWDEPHTVEPSCIAQCCTIVRTAANLAPGTTTWGAKLAGGNRIHFERPRLIKMAAACVLGASLLAVLAFPIPMQIESTARLMPISSRELFAPHEGRVEQVHVQHGQSVRAGDLCATLQSTTLQAQLEQAFASHLKSQQRFGDLEGKLLRDRSLTAVERDSIESERDAMRQVIALEKSGLESLEKQSDALKILAPVDGVIETWGVEESLRERPVRTGQWLMTIREDQAGWRFEADFPENRILELMQKDGEKPFFAFARMLASPQSAIPLRIDRNQTFRVADVENNASAPSSQRHQMRVYFDIDTVLPQELTTTGAKARIAVHMGYAPVIWVLTKDFAEDLAVRFRMWLP